MKPSSNHLASAAVGSIGSPIRRAAININGLVGGPVQRLAMSMSKWLEQRAGRRRLQSLDDHMLKDIGVARCDIERKVGTAWFDE